jgi:hypothetical protein
MRLGPSFQSRPRFQSLGLSLCLCLGIVTPRGVTEASLDPTEVCRAVLESDRGWQWEGWALYPGPDFWNRVGNVGGGPPKYFTSSANFNASSR